VTESPPPEQPPSAPRPAPGEPPPQRVVIEQRGNIFTRGMRMGVTGCVGCLTFLVLAIVLFVVAIGACSRPRR
jgi:hypothetical protein